MTRTACTGHRFRDTLIVTSPEKGKITHQHYRGGYIAVKQNRKPNQTMNVKLYTRIAFIFLGILFFLTINRSVIRMNKYGSPDGTSSAFLFLIGISIGLILTVGGAISISQGINDRNVERDKALIAKQKNVPISKVSANRNNPGKYHPYATSSPRTAVLTAPRVNQTIRG